MFPGFYLFDKYISSYVLTSLAGIFTACPLAIYHYKKRGGNDISMIFVFLFGGIGCMFGMHLLYGITNIRQWGSLFSAAFSKGSLIPRILGNILPGPNISVVLRW